MELSLHTKQGVSIIGTGNVGWHLASVLFSVGYPIQEIYASNLEKASQSAQYFSACVATCSLDFSKSKSLIFIIAVSDNAIEDIASRLIVPDSAIVLHTSGATSIRVLEKHKHFGVFYPLQTISKQVKLNWKTVPILIESGLEEDLHFLQKLTSDISDSVFVINSQQRKSLHLAAVFSNNFVNHLLAISEQILDKEQIPFSILEGLVKQTVDKAFANSAKDSQTGPAIRNDTKTINAHRELLEENLLHQSVYESLTKSISGMYQDK